MTYSTIYNHRRGHFYSAKKRFPTEVQNLVKSIKAFVNYAIIPGPNRCILPIYRRVFAQQIITAQRNYPSFSHSPQIVSRAAMKTP
jgi:hypothetical protein